MPRKKIEPAPMDAEPIQDTPAETIPQPAEEPKRSTRTRDSDLLTISDQERGITPEDSEDVKWNYIAGAARRHQILTGIVSGVENTDNGSTVCVVDYEGIRILIPVKEMFVEELPETGEIPRSFRMRLGRILGGTVDFMLAGVDMKNRIAVASRRNAMLQRQAKYYATGRIKEGIRVACRVTGVGNGYINVEAIGVDAEINAGQLSWEWFADAVDLYSTGDLVVAKVLKVEKNEQTGHYSVGLSVKAATENPDLPALRKLVPRSNYYGVVTGVRDKLIFVRLQAGANAKTMTYHSKEIPSKLDTVSFQVRSINEEAGMAFGVVTRIIKRHARLR
jgi:ribosomal protein S1